MLGLTPGSHTTLLKTSTLSGVCQRHADMHKVSREQSGYVIISSDGYVCKLNKVTLFNDPVSIIMAKHS